MALFQRTQELLTFLFGYSATCFRQGGNQRSFTDLQSQYGTGTEPRSIIQSAESAGSGRPEPLSQSCTTTHFMVFLLTHGRYGGKSAPFRLTLGLVPFRKFPVPSRSVYLAQTIRPDPYRGLKSGPRTISSGNTPLFDHLGTHRRLAEQEIMVILYCFFSPTTGYPTKQLLHQRLSYGRSMGHSISTYHAPVLSSFLGHKQSIFNLAYGRLYHSVIVD